MSNKVIFQVENHIARIRLNRPNALNALDNDMIADLIDYLIESKKNDEIRVVIIEEMERHFVRVMISLTWVQRIILIPQIS